MAKFYRYVYYITCQIRLPVNACLLLTRNLPAGTMYQFIFFACSLLLLLGCSPATVSTITDQPGTKELPPAEILELVEGNTLYIQSSEEDSYLFFDPSSRLFGKDLYANRDTGRWDVSEDGQVCLKMKSWWYGDLKCYRIFMRGDREKIFLANSADVVEYSAVYFAGDSKHLFVAPAAKKKSFRKSARQRQQQPTTSSSEEQNNSRQQQKTEQYAVTEPTTTDHASKDTQATVKWVAKNCPGCNMDGADLNKANLVEANLAGTNLANADLQMANLRRANLRGANLRNAVLKYANLPGANLQNADLRGADLQGANLIRANLTGAKLDGANLQEAHIDGTIGLN
ncbi:pentapeptide repeat-containing protein [Desulfogranum marinum]|uniref:pentapeptide repeat-containing protein n=1 Tax=Desulfogranum marinum TaxID=453220 RepID=UPI0029C6D913|nr:pentapeptide repeat-containing protein [Desulfogranum marinum]